METKTGGPPVLLCMDCQGTGDSTKTNSSSRDGEVVREKSLFVKAMEELEQMEKDHGREAVTRFVENECRKSALIIDSYFLGVTAEALRKLYISRLVHELEQSFVSCEHWIGGAGLTGPTGPTGKTK